MTSINPSKKDRIYITSECFKTYRQCKYKLALKMNGNEGVRSEYDYMLHGRQEQFRREAINRCYSTVFDKGMKTIFSDKSNKAQLAEKTVLFNAEIKSGDKKAYFDVLEQVKGKSCLGVFHYIPVLFQANNKITKEDLNLLGYNGVVIGTYQGRIPEYAKIVYGTQFSQKKVELKRYIQIAKKNSEEIKQIIDGHIEPCFILNSHCQICEFRNLCKNDAIEKDDLSLLSGMTEKEIVRQKKKGIFTVTQYSYTFRPRKRSKAVREITKHRMFELRALAIRTGKTYIFNIPKLKICNTTIYVDIEGDPDRGFNYLIGLLIVKKGIEIKKRFWADNSVEEEAMFLQFLKEIGRYKKFQIFCYGSYEVKYFKKMHTKMKNRMDFEQEKIAEKVKNNTINVLSLIYSNIYFPTYSNDLKSIGNHLRFNWSEKEASGLQSIVWRMEWEKTHCEKVKEKIMQYNIEDCMALRKVTDTIYQIILDYQGQEENYNMAIDTVLVDELKPEKKFGAIDFYFKDLEFVNNCAYFDYQHQKVYCKTSVKNKRRKRKQCISDFSNKVNSRVDVPIDRKCFNCGKRTYRSGIYTKREIDLKFSKSGIKRWIVDYRAIRMRCKHCKKTEIPTGLKKVKKYGHGLMSWILYHNIVHHQPFGRIAMDLEVFFGLKFPRGVIHNFKNNAASYYESTYDAIFKKLTNGSILHVDETKVNMKSGKEYVWVFTNLEEVAFLHTPTREGVFLKDLLNGFKGVLISDFYATYEKIECEQQKCLIHLIRDLNEDLYKNPFDIEYKDMVSRFSLLMKSIVETINKYGLKKRNLNKHKAEVNKYFNYISNMNYNSELATKYQKRFLKNRSKLFTFLNYTGVPWNNNNAEHAIKHFADYRRTVSGLTRENGLRNYLIMLSIYQTCEYKGLNFLKYMLSKEMNIDVYFKGLGNCESANRKKAVNLDFQKYNWH